MPQGVTRGSKLHCNVTQFGRCCGHNRTFKVTGLTAAICRSPLTYQYSFFLCVALTRIERSDDFSPSSAMSVLLPVPFIPLNAMCPRQKVPSWGIRANVWTIFSLGFRLVRRCCHQPKQSELNLCSSVSGGELDVEAGKGRDQISRLTFPRCLLAWSR